MGFGTGSWGMRDTMLGLDCGAGGLRSRFWTGIALVALMVACGGCHRKVGVAGGQASPGQKTFASPSQAAQALMEAARNNDQQQMLAIFGPDSRSILYSGGGAEDRASLAEFASDYQVMNRWRKLDNGSQLLLVGAANTPFPIPLGKDRSGQWYFDVPAGRTELEVRRIGRNELAVIDLCASLADAQEEYYAQAHDGVKQYARKFISDAGKENGLYWPAGAGKTKSPVGPLLAYASEQGRRLQPNLYKPYHGYYFGILDKQGFAANGGLRDYIREDVMSRGFGFVAYPAEYGKSGIMTFIINRDRLVFQKDLGPTTRDQAAFMTAFNPEWGWVQVKQ